MTSICCLPKSGQAAAMRESLPGGAQIISLRYQLRGVAKLFTHPTYRLIMLLVMIGGIAGAGIASMYLLYLKEMFGMDMTSLGPVLGLSALSNLVGQVFLVKPLEKCLGVRGAVIFSFAAGTVSSIAYVFIPSVNLLYLLAAASGLSSIAVPIIAALLTNVTEPGNEAGDVGVSLGMLQSVSSITTIVGPLLFKVVFSAFLQPSRTFVGAVWVLSSLLSVVGLVLACWLPKAMTVEDEQQREVAGEVAPPVAA